MCFPSKSYELYMGKYLSSFLPFTLGKSVKVKMQQWLRAGLLTKHKASFSTSTQTEVAALTPSKKYNMSPRHQIPLQER